MNVDTMNIQSWQSMTPTRPSSVVPTYGFCMGDVRPMTLNASTKAAIAAVPANKRHAVATHAVVKGPQPWSPPVT